MKQFIKSTFMFLLPFILSIPSLIFYTTKQGDLIRMGYIKKESDYREIFNNEFNRSIFYHDMSSFKLKKQKKYNLLIVGDSFSEQGGFGYKNYIAEHDSIRVIHFKRLENRGNPIENLYGIINGDILDSVPIDFVVLQCAERYFVIRGEYLDKSFKTFKEDQLTLINNTEDEPEAIKSFPPKELWKFPLYNLLYHFSDNAYFSDVYKVKINQPLFSSSNPNTLLFTNEDLLNVEINNNHNSVLKLNSELNNLSSILNKRNIKLIVLPSPDKYDLFYSFIEDKTKYPKPLFFDIIDSLPKKYMLVESKQILSQHLQRQKDLYFYDDTHWSPFASKILADEISKMIFSEKKLETQSSP